MNNKYDANGFADLVNAIQTEEYMTSIKSRCQKFGGSNEQFKKIFRLEFIPFDELRIDQDFS